MPPSPIPLLIASIGNPGPQYAHTLHSAGHSLLSALRTHLSFPPFHKDRTLASGLVSRLPPPSSPPSSNLDAELLLWTLWQSPSLMNLSGPTLAASFRAWRVQLGLTLPPASASASASGALAGKLILLHDDLETAPGKLKVRSGAGWSAKGHNGVKSVLGCLSKAEVAGSLVRVGVGIGRPESRERGDVAGFVLGRMGGEVRGRVEGCVGGLVGVLRAVGGEGEEMGVGEGRGGVSGGGEGNRGRARG